MANGTVLFSTYEINPADLGYVIEIDHFDGGATSRTMIPVAGAAAAPANFAALVTKAQAALATNEAFLTSIANATYPLSTAEQQALVAQVVACTRQIQAVILFLLHAITGLTTIPGT
jgi:hypothetical protein